MKIATPDGRYGSDVLSALAIPDTCRVAIVNRFDGKRVVGAEMPMDATMRPS